MIKDVTGKKNFRHYLPYNRCSLMFLNAIVVIVNHEINYVSA